MTTTITSGVIRRLCCSVHRVYIQEMMMSYAQNAAQRSALADLGFLEGGVTLGTRASETNEHRGGLGLRENEIWSQNDIEITSVTRIIIT